MGPEESQIERDFNLATYLMGGHSGTNIVEWAGHVFNTCVHKKCVRNQIISLLTC